MRPRPRRSRTLRAAALLVLAATSAAGCASSAKLGPEPRADAPPEAEVETLLRTEAQSWMGAPHAWGGLSREGVDCSGLTFRMYADVFGLSLPRTTAEQVRAGVPVERKALRAGDLVFFHTQGKRTRHVGIYLCCGEFVHASSSRGVMISNLDEPYWRDAYWTARRLLSPPDAGTPAARDTSNVRAW